MDSTYLTSPLIFLIQSILGIYVTLVVLRLLLQWVRADFYNPISQLIVTALSPLLKPLRHVIPNIAGIDLAAVILAWGLKALELLLVMLLLNGRLYLFAVVWWAIPELMELIANIFIVAILLQVIFSWITPFGSYNPAADLASSLAEILLVPAQRLLPLVPGLDFSPIVATVAIVMLKMLLLPPLKAITNSPF